MNRVVAVVLTLLLGCREQPMDTAKKPHRTYHPAESGIRGEEPSEIYDLPAESLPVEQRAGLTPWIGEVATQPSPDGPNERYDSRWAVRADSPFAALARHYRGYRPESLVTRGPRAWLLCVKPETDVTAEDSCLVPEPADRAEVRDRLHRLGFDDPLLAEFLTYFAGWREDFEPNAGDFVRIDDLDVDRVLKVDDWLSTYDGIERYEGSLRLYSARNGNMLLVHPSGRVGWLIGQEQVARDFAADFRGFCEKYTAHRTTFVRYHGNNRLVSWPFDAYGKSR